MKDRYSHMKIKKDFMLRNVAGSNIVVPVGSLSKDFHGMITLNQTGAFLWKLLEQETDEEALVSAVLAGYEVDEAQAREAVGEFIEQLRQADCLA